MTRSQAANNVPGQAQWYFSHNVHYDEGKMGMGQCPIPRGLTGQNFINGSDIVGRQLPISRFGIVLEVGKLGSAGDD